MTAADAEEVDAIEGATVAAAVAETIITEAAVAVEITTTTAEGVENVDFLQGIIHSIALKINSFTNFKKKI